jgi:nitroimidazol reductase NimA-like FMN-containing flavoprotein (pyridoxamine 5'-phosphate oxidase superfamily)
MGGQAAWRKYEFRCKMRRKEKEIMDTSLIAEIIRDCEVCRLGLARNNSPYVVPVSFGYDGPRGAIYFHTAREGKKLDYIQANNAVCFEFERCVRLVPKGKNPCEWSVSFQSVIGYGKVRELAGDDEKKEALGYIVEHYAGSKLEFSRKAMRDTRVWKINIEEITGKQSEDNVKGR